MWILECEGDLLGGKRIWLRPGIIHVFGRARSGHKGLDEHGNPFHGVNHKSVSRKHVTITADPIPTGHSSEYRQKSVLKLEDFSKTGTIVDSNRVKTKTLDGKNHQIKLGSWGNVIRVSWIEVSLALVYLNKKTGQSGLLDMQGKVEKFDIKLSPNFQGDSTTHVVAAKRNVPDVLEGLVSGAYIVTQPYIDEIITACTPGESKKAPLEEDFDLAWPDPLKFIPPQSKEPVPRTEDYLVPKPERADMFSNFTFVFCLANQLDGLAKPINRGGGKTILYDDYRDGSSTPEQLADFMKDFAMRQSKSKTVVFVRIQIVEPNTDWKTQFIQRLDLIMGRRSVAQNEFLDVILTCDTDTLKKPLEEDHVPYSAPIGNSNGTRKSSGSGVDATSRHGSNSVAIIKEDPSPVKTLSSKRLRYGKAVSKFKGFDDFKTESLPPVSSIPMDEEDQEMEDYEHESLPQNQNDAQQVVVDTASASKHGSKRARDQSAIDALLPGAAAMKKRRIASGQDAESQSVNADSQLKREMKDPPPRQTLFKKTTIPKDMAGEKELEEAAIRAEKRTEEEERKEPLSTEEIRAVREGIQIENIAIRSRPRATKTVNTDDWDPRWNGRKNFKRFKRAGDGPQPLRGTRVTIRLEEAKPKDNFLLGSVRQGARTNKVPKKDKQQSGGNHSDSDDESQFRPAHITNPANVSDGDFSDHDIGDISLDLDVLPARYRQKANRNADPQSLRAVVPNSISTQGRKRPATGRSTAEASPPPKRTASSAQTSRSSRRRMKDDSEESSGESEFRFNPGGKAKPSRR